MNSPDPIPLGKYRGFETELLFNTAERNYEVRLKGATSRNVPLGDDAYGNIIRLDNGIERYVEKCKELSLYDTDVTAEYGDKLLTLSTCEYSRTNGRLVVVAKLINE